MIKVSKKDFLEIFFTKFQNLVKKYLFTKFFLWGWVFY